MPTPANRHRPMWATRAAVPVGEAMAVAAVMTAVMTVVMTAAMMTAVAVAAV
jgi:hypothetical protein